MESKTFVFRSFVNSFHYLYGDAEYLNEIIHKKEMEGLFERVRLCRTALLLYILSSEGLINRALERFLPERLREFFLQREERLSVADKWLVLPLLASEKQQTFDKSRYPWSHFAELLQVRNEYVHPKHDRPAYYRVISAQRWEPLPWKDIPKDIDAKETDIVYRQTRIPKDPYAIRPNHVDEVKKIVDDTIAELNRLLDGRVLKDDWHKSDEMKLIYPPGATIRDLSTAPRPAKP